MWRTISLILFLPVYVSAQSARQEGDSVFQRSLKAYRAGERDWGQVVYLAKTAKQLHQDKLADSIGQDYIVKYLSDMKRDEFLTKENLIFFVSFNGSSPNGAFRMFYQNQDTVDGILASPHYAQSYIDYIIAKEEVDPKFFWNGNLVKNVPWGHIRSEIARKYNRSYADRVILNAQVRWYGSQRKVDTAMLVKYVIKKMDKYGMDTIGFGRALTNNMIYEVVFRYSSKNAALNEAIVWMKRILVAEPDNADFLDTYANLLYKVGRKEEAISTEETALKLSRKHDEMAQNLVKMKNGEPTWPAR
jgi:tetratricopeptide (TPR) repeat protein